MTAKYTFLGFCDNLRRTEDCGEESWNNMIKNKEEILEKDFLINLDASKLLDEDETISDYLNNLKEEDNIKYYKSKWGKKDCKFIKTSGTNGYEIIFVKNENKEINEHFESNENLDFSGFKMNKSLNNIIWDNNMLMKDMISNGLLKIAKDYFISLKLSLPVKDITMTGSLANYNWSKYSDIDLHIVVDLNKFGEDKELVKGLIDSKSREWNDKHDITIKGYEVEVYIQDIDEEHHSTGVYSILKDKWIIKPEIKDDYIDKKLVTKKYNDIVNKVNDIVLNYKKDKDYNTVIDKTEKLKDKIKRMRQAGLEGEGEYSTENIVFKLLRRNDVMKKINDLLIKSYDKSMTIDEEIIKNLTEEDIKF